VRSVALDTFNAVAALYGSHEFLTVIHRFATQWLRFMDAYRKGLQGKQLQQAAQCICCQKVSWSPHSPFIYFRRSRYYQQVKHIVLTFTSIPIMMFRPTLPLLVTCACITSGDTMVTQWSQHVM
jgi:hypothetical protein